MVVLEHNGGRGVPFALLKILSLEKLNKSGASTSAELMHMIDEKSLLFIDNHQELSH